MTGPENLVDASQTPENNPQISQAHGDREEVTPVFDNDLLSKYANLEIAYAALQMKTSILESKNKYWSDLFRKVDKAIAIKVNEFETLQKAHHELKEKHKMLKGGECHQTGKTDNNLTQTRIRQLEDQVRARDLVIELMKKAEAERIQKDMQEKLEQQRREIEQQLGLPQEPTTTASRLLTLKYKNTSMPGQSGVLSPGLQENGEREPSAEAEFEGLDIDAEIDNVLEELFNESDGDS